MLKVSTVGIGKAINGISNDPSNAAVGVQGDTTSSNGYGVYGLSRLETDGGVGVYGQANAPDGAGVVGVNTANSANARGVKGTSVGGIGVYGFSTNNYGGFFESLNGPGLRIKSGGAGNILTSFGADNAIKFQVDKDGKASFADTLSVATVLARAFNVLSDRNHKTNFKRVDVGKILEQVVRLPITRWNYKEDAANIAHLGPMTQDFHATFGLNGSDKKRISTVDAQDVALAAVQGLNQKLEKKLTGFEGENAVLRKSLTALEARLSKLESKIKETV